MHAYGILDTPPEVGFEDIVVLAAEICHAPVALVSLVGSERQWFKARIGFEACETPISQSVCVYALAQAEPLVIPDLSLDPRTAANTLVTGPPFVRFYAGAPLITPDGLAIGTICVLDVAPRPKGLSEGQAKALQALARQVMLLLESRLIIIERERQLVEQHASGARTLSAAEAGGVGTFEVDVTSGQMAVSPETCRLFGLPVAPTYPASIFETLVIDQDRDIISNATSRLSRAAELDVEYRIRRADDGRVRWIARRARFASDAAGPGWRMMGTVQDMTEEKLSALRVSAMVELGDELRQAATTEIAVAVAARLLGQVLAVDRAGYAHIHPQEGLFVVEREWLQPGTRSAVGRHSLQHFPETVARLSQGETLVMADTAQTPWLGRDRASYARLGVRAQVALPLLAQGQLVAVLFLHDRNVRHWSADELQFIKDLADRTYVAMLQLQAEQQQHIVNQEISHRLKNNMAMVQALANQTLRSLPERQSVKVFEQRLMALSKAHDVLFQKSPTGSDAPVGDVVDAALQATGHADRFDIAGPDLMVGARSALSLSLVLHEMTTNAVKYGALSGDLGRIAVRWQVLDRKGEPHFILTWREEGGPPAVEPTRSGFGSRLIRAGLAGAGGVTLRYTPNGFSAEMTENLSHLQQT